MSRFVDVGKVRFTPKGPYSASTAYEYFDVVEYLGNGYVNVSPNGSTGVAPTDTTTWKEFSGSQLGALTVSATTLEPGSDASVTYSSTTAHMTFGIPKGLTGNNGVYLGPDEPTDEDQNVWLDTSPSPVDGFEIPAGDVSLIGRESGHTLTWDGKAVVTASSLSDTLSFVVNPDDGTVSIEY